MTQSVSEHPPGHHAHHGGAAAPDPWRDYAVPPGRDPLTAFAQRAFAAPWRGATPIPEADTQSVMAQVLATPRTGPTVAYIHVPYCQNHCVFCGFFENVWRSDASAVYVDDVVAEIARLAATPLVASGPIDAVYIGGGTPTALALPDLARLIAGLALLPLSKDCEITLEGRAYDFGLDKALAAMDAGANRISLGVQSFDTQVRRRLGRKLSGADVGAFLFAIVGQRGAAVACDLMYGLPGQSEAIWRRDIDTAIELGLDGVSLYALNVWRGGPLAKAIEAGKLPGAADVAGQASAYAAAVDRLTGQGWRHVSQAHFVRSPRERNRYNLMLKSGATCLAFGPGAGGNAHGYRWRNVVDMGRRRALVLDGKYPVERLAPMPPRHAARTAVVAGLEAGALDIARVDAAAPGFRAAAAPLLGNWAGAGLGDLRDDAFRTTAAGAFWIATLTAALHAVIDRSISSDPTGAQS